VSHIQHYRPPLIHPLTLPYPTYLTLPLTSNIPSFRNRECWCAPYLSSLSTEVPVEECNLACAGNSSEMCGGALRLSLYEMQGSAGSGSSKKGGSSAARPAACLVVGGVAMLFFFICSGGLL